MKRPRLNLMLRTALLAWLVAIVALVIYASALLPEQKREHLASLGSKAHGVTISLRDLTASAVVTEDFSSVVDHCNEVLRGDPSIAYIILTRRDGFSLVHERTGWRTDQLGDAWHPVKRTALSAIGTEPPINRRVFNLSEPFDYSGIEWGWIHIGLSLEAYDASIRRLYQRTLLLGAAAGLLAFGASIIYARLLIRPILQLQSVVGRVTAGELTARAAVDRNDELGALASSVNSMTEAILLRDRTLHEANFRLEERVEERTRELRELIAARELAHNELAEVQRQLINLSRQAGMAEVATGVLHNVGNVLNSVNVSANLLRDGLSSHHSRVSLLAQTAQLLRGQADLPAFFSSDPRGRHVPALLHELADQLDRHHQTLLREVNQLNGNIDHIKQIVAAQQDYAKSGGVFQTFDPAELFTEALRITQPERHGVTLTPSYPRPSPGSVSTDRHQAIHILVNFLANAIQAVQVRAPGERHIRLTLERVNTHWHLGVEDNGMGIRAEDLQRIFQHGFTTRRDGHGFGLHSGALSARRLGGHVLAHSDGPDRGARFLLYLPATPAPKP